MRYLERSDLLTFRTLTTLSHTLTHTTHRGGNRSRWAQAQAVWQAGALHRESRWRAPGLLWGPDNTEEQRGLSTMEGALSNLRELHNSYDVLIWLCKAWYLTRPEKLCILTLYSWHQYESSLAIKEATWCIHVSSMYFWLISLVHSIVIDILTQLMQKDNLENLGGNWKAPVFKNHNPPQLESFPRQCHSHTNRVPPECNNICGCWKPRKRGFFYVIGWTQWVFWLIEQIVSNHIFFKPVDGICRWALSDDSCHHIVKVVILRESDWRVIAKMAQSSFRQVSGATHKWIYLYKDMNK